MAKRKKSRLRRREARAAWGFLLPSLLGISLLVLVPFVEAIRRSLYNNPGTRFLGLHNYRSVLDNPAFKLAAENTGKFILACIPILLAISFILALSVQAMGKLVRGYKTTFLLPMAIGACTALGGNVLTDAFGVVSMVAMTPLIAIQIMGCVFRLKARRQAVQTVTVEEIIELL